jgi:hypothetical protein
MSVSSNSIDYTERYSDIFVAARMREFVSSDKDFLPMRRGNRGVSRIAIRQALKTGEIQFTDECWKYTAISEIDFPVGGDSDILRFLRMYSPAPGCYNFSMRYIPERSSFPIPAESGETFVHKLQGPIFRAILFHSWENPFLEDLVITEGPNWEPAHGRIFFTRRLDIPVDALDVPDIKGFDTEPKGNPYLISGSVLFDLKRYLAERSGCNKT